MNSFLKRTHLRLKNNLFPLETIPEAAIAYNCRLPSEIEVSWFRDGKFIIGNIKTHDTSFMTQAKSAKEFVDMVNDALYAVYDIPIQYAQLPNMKKLVPKPGEFQKLSDTKIHSSVIGFIPLLT